MRRSAAAAACTLVLALMAPFAQAQGNPPLREVDKIDNSLMMVAIADDLRKSCDTIDARMIRALAYLQQLKGEARDLGYSSDEIDAYVSSDDEKDRMERKANAWLEGQGVQRSDKSAYCTFGQQEIAKGSQIGVLLRAR